MRARAGGTGEGGARGGGGARALERLLEEGRERVCVLEGVLEGERWRREEWECGLEALVLNGSRV